MTLLQRLAGQVLSEHPTRAALALERIGAEQATLVLAGSRAETVGTIVRQMSPHLATAVLEGLGAEEAAGVLGALPVDVATRLVRRTDEATQLAILGHVPARRMRSIQSMLRFPEGSAGALMDPDVLALPQELGAREALQRVRRAAESARYNLYVVDSDQKLVGALNLRELLIARGRLPLSDIMVRNPHRIAATADRAAVMAHPGWKQVHALPVVDASDAYLGAIRYRRLRELERELLAPRGRDMDAGSAFGQVIAAAAGGVLDALGGAVEPAGGEDHGA